MIDRVGRNQIIEELGRGGMGVVYKAHDTSLDRPVAIKFLAEGQELDERLVLRFFREARNASQLNHQHIAQIHYVDEFEGRPYFVMEYVKGGSLADYLVTHGYCAPKVARRIAFQVANALAAAAEQGLVHRDIKPGNIMLDERGKVKLTDFGIACLHPSSGGDTIRDVSGTPAYLPPEVLNGAQPDFRGDIFSLGAVYYEMLTGNRLIEARSLPEAREIHNRPGFPDLSALSKLCDKSEFHLITNMLEPDPESRWSAFKPMLEAMAALQDAEQGDTPTPLDATEVGRELPDDQTQGASATQAASPRTEPATVLGSTRGGRARQVGLIGTAMLALVMLALGLARMDHGEISESPLGGLAAMVPFINGEEPAKDKPQQPREDRTKESGLAEEPGRQVAQEASPRSPETLRESMLPDRDATEDDSGDALALRQEQRTQRSEPQTVPERTERLSETDRKARAEGDSVAAAQQPAEPEAEPEPVYRPRGVVVLALGDPVIADPMARIIESSLDSRGYQLVDKRFISGHESYLGPSDVDLSGLASQAVGEGARFVVLARALDAGQREAAYYGRREMLQVSQVDVVTYDLLDRRMLGRSRTDDIVYSSRNATEKAERSGRELLAEVQGRIPRLDGSE